MAGIFPFDEEAGGGQVDLHLTAEKLEEDGDPLVPIHVARDDRAQVLEGPFNDDDFPTRAEDRGGNFFKVFGVEAGLDRFNEPIGDARDPIPEGDKVANAADGADLAVMDPQVGVHEDISRKEAFDKVHPSPARFLFIADARAEARQGEFPLQGNGGEVFLFRKGLEAVPARFAILYSRHGSGGSAFADPENSGFAGALDEEDHFVRARIAGGLVEQSGSV